MIAVNPDVNKVLIVGAGIGGLALAQVLRKQNVPYEIFERDTGLSSRKQGWAIALIECLPDLAKLLPNDLGDWRTTSVNAGTGEPDELAVLDMSTGQEIATMRAGLPTDKSYFLRSGREEFRDFLWNHIPVTTGKQFSHYEEDIDSVTVQFKDGTHATGAILVGADGASSHMRQQLMDHTPDSLPTLSPYIPIIGEAHLTRDQFEPLDRIANAAILGGAPAYRYMVGKLSVSPDRSSARYYYAMCFQSSDPARDSAWAATASPQDLFDKVLSYTPAMDPLLASIIHIAGPDGIVTPPIKFQEFVSPTSLPAGRVTLLGDAAHSMIPFRGAGANTAIKDACDLGRLLIRRHQTANTTTPTLSLRRSGGDGSGDWIDLIQEYNRTMLKRGREVVLSSRRAGEGLSGIMGVVDGRVATTTAAAAAAAALEMKDDTIVADNNINMKNNKNVRNESMNEDSRFNGEDAIAETTSDVNAAAPIVIGVQSGITA